MQFVYFSSVRVNVLAKGLKSAFLALLLWTPIEHMYIDAF